MCATTPDFTWALWTHTQVVLLAQQARYPSPSMDEPLCLFTIALVAF